MARGSIPTFDFEALLAGAGVSAVDNDASSPHSPSVQFQEPAKDEAMPDAVPGRRKRGSDAAELGQPPAPLSQRCRSFGESSLAQALPSVSPPGPPPPLPAGGPPPIPGPPPALPENFGPGAAQGVPPPPHGRPSGRVSLPPRGDGSHLASSAPPDMREVQLGGAGDVSGGRRGSVPTTMEGHLMKYSGGKSGLSLGAMLNKPDKRWCVLAPGGVFEWHKEQAHKEQGAEAAGSLRVLGCALKLLDDGESFTLHGTDRTLTLRASSDSEARKWGRALLASGTSSESRARTLLSRVSDQLIACLIRRLTLRTPR
jgi:hypothetical protein